MNISQVKNWMREHTHLYRCERTGELNHTRLVQEAACALNLYVDGYDIPENVFEIAEEFE